MFASLRFRPLVLLVVFSQQPLFTASACGPSFYAAAPPLVAGDLPLAVKTLAELYDLTVTPKLSAEQAETIRNARIAAAAEAMKLPLVEARAGLEKLIAENRNSGAQAAVANLLWDLRDTLDSTPETSPQRERWIAWRLEQVRDNAVTTLQRPVALNAKTLWKEAAEANEKARQSRDAAAENEISALSAAGLADAPASLQPHWRIQAGAVWFRAQHFAKAAEAFESVARDFPNHPRAETAAFMALRCRIELARDAIGEWHQRQDPRASAPELTAAWDHFHAFAERFGKGRFAADLPGWRGALCVLAGDWPQAFCAYIEQADHTEQPGITRTALREAERCLRLAAEHGGAVDVNDSSLAESLAAHPRAAVRFVYHLLEPAAAVNFDQWPWMSEESEGAEAVKFRRAARWKIREEFRSLLPQLAQALTRTNTATPGAWDPFALAVIAWAACEDGEYERVLTLCRHHPAQLDAGDDLQMVRAIALQRMGRPAEAVRAWNDLANTFSDSPLCAQARQRIVASLVEAGYPAGALVATAPPPPATPILEEPAPPEEGSPPAFVGTDLDQWRDALALAAPLESLQTAFRSGDSAAKWIGPVIARRLAARGRYAEAREFLTEPTVAETDMHSGDWWHHPSPLPVSEGGADAFADVIGALRTAETATAGEASAHSWLAAGEAVAALRAKWTLEQALGSYMNSESRQWLFRVRRNARTLGFSGDAVTEEILRQDPLGFAGECWAKAVAAAPDSPAAARALFLQNEALRLRAEYTPFAAEAADASDWTAKSAHLVEALHAMPVPAAKILAKSAVPWQFREMTWLPGNQSEAYADTALEQVMAPVSESEAAAVMEMPPIEAMTREAFGKGGPEAALQTLGELRAVYCGSLLNHDPERWHGLRLIGDLTAAMRVPGLTPEQRASCVDWVTGASLEYVKDTSGWEDLVSYAALRAMEYPRYSPELPAKWQLWLAENPKSVRVEDASFQFLRAECRRHRGWTRLANTPWPAGPLTNSFYLVIQVDRAAPAAPEYVRSLLDAFDQRLPDSKFAADVALLRCGAAIDRKDWDTALDQVLPLIEGKTHRELHVDAAHLTADIFLHLLEPEGRAPLAAAIRARPAALRCLARFMSSDTPGGRLLPFRDWFGIDARPALVSDR